MKLFCTALLMISFATSVFAGENEARLVRDAIGWTAGDDAKARDVEEVIELRTTRGMHQGWSNFCWVFGSMGMLESYFLEANPGVDPEDVELSRWAFREETGGSHVPGVSVDAFYYYSPEMGMYGYSDYESNGAGGDTFFQDEAIDPFDLRELMLGDHQFWSYGFSETESGWHGHVDSDAQRGTQSYLVPPEMKEKILVNSLQAGKAVTITVDRHVILLHGVELDDAGRAVKYFIKDSYDPYFYEASADRTHQRIWEITSFANAHLQ